MNKDIEITRKENKYKTKKKLGICVKVASTFVAGGILAVGGIGISKLVQSDRANCEKLLTKYDYNLKNNEYIRKLQSEHYDKFKNGEITYDEYIDELRATRDGLDKNEFLKQYATDQEYNSYKTSKDLSPVLYVCTALAAGCIATAVGAGVYLLGDNIEAGQI